MEINVSTAAEIIGTWGQEAEYREDNLKAQFALDGLLVIARQENLVCQKFIEQQLDELQRLLTGMPSYDPDFVIVD